MAAGDCYRALFAQTVHGNPVLNVFDFIETIAADFDGDAPASIAEDFQSEIALSFASVLSEDWVGNGVQIGRVDPGPINPYTLLFVGALAVVGEVVSEAIPSNSPAVITKYTDQPTRRGRGRWYQSGFPETKQDCGQILTAEFADWQAVMESVMVPLAELGGGAGRWRLAVRSEVDNATRLVTHITARPNIANMRPRRSPPATV